MSKLINIMAVSAVLSSLSFSGLAANAIGGGKIKETYQQFCASCHGKNLTGGLGSNLVDDTWLHGNSDFDIGNTIRNGRLDAGMPAWKNALSDDQIRAMVVFIREEKHIAKERALTQRLKPTNGVYTTEDYAFTLKLEAEFEDLVWSLSFLPNGDWVATEQIGRLWYKNNQSKNSEIKKIENMPKTWFFKQAGFFDVVPDPDYQNNGWLYLSYAEDKGAKENGKTAGMTGVVRGKIINGAWQEQQVVFSADKELHKARGIHFGSRIVLDDKYIYFSIGERGKQDLAQDITTLNGKIHRLHHNGDVPKNNPFVAKNNAFSSVWTLGHRNPQGLALHPKTKQVWQTEHGARGGDEVNLIEGSRNYGWPVITHGINYDGSSISDKTAQKGMEQPKHYWVPSIATAGIEFYQGQQFSKWQNNLLITGMGSKDVRRLVIDNQKVIKEEVLAKVNGRVRDVAVSPSGDIYIVVNDNNKENGKIYKLVPQ